MMDIIKNEASRIVRFGLVGIAATVTSVTISQMLFFLVDSAYVCNICGHMGGMVVAFTGHYYFTFSSANHKLYTFFRFSVVTLFTLLMTLGLLYLIEKIFADEPGRIALLIATLAAPIFSYLGMRLWAFK